MAPSRAHPRAGEATIHALASGKDGTSRSARVTVDGCRAAASGDPQIRTGVHGVLHSVIHEDGPIGELLSFAELGVHHILDANGLDHVVFLVALAAIYRSKCSGSSPPSPSGTRSRSPSRSWVRSPCPPRSSSSSFR